MDTLETVLSHYGVKGMKWGVRKSKKQLRKEAKARAAQESDDAKAASKALDKANKKGIQSLSNDELKSLNERLNLEQNYSRLAQDKGEASKVETGAKFVRSQGGQVLLSATRSVATELVRREIEKKVGLRSSDGRKRK